MNYGFVIDNRSCIGCHACSTACKSENEVPLGVYRTWVKYVEKGRFPHARRSFQVTRCNHCANPPCARICPVTAMYQRADGIVEFDGEACIGCKACMQACPYDAIYIDPNSGTAAKCHYCAHRTDIGLEPACVVVCPTEAIVAGDLDDPESRISRLVAREPVSVRKPEQGTIPKLFYIDGDETALTPTAALAPGALMWSDLVSEQAVSSGPHPPAPSPADAGHSPSGGALRAGEGEIRVEREVVKRSVARSESGGEGIRRPEGQDAAAWRGPLHLGGGTLAEHMVQVGYNAQHKVPWHWQVPAYLVTKAIGSGAYMLMVAFLALRIVEPEPSVLIAGNLMALLFIGLTTALLVMDLERPERFLRVLTRPQWSSWLTRGAYILVGFSAVTTVALFAELGWFGEALADQIRLPMMTIGFGLAILSAIYTAFLFGQCEGRDLWQSAVLPLQMLNHALLAGSAAWLILLLSWDLVRPPGPHNMLAIAQAFVAFLLLSAITILSELREGHASDVSEAAVHAIRQGKYRRYYLLGVIGFGHVLPVLVFAPLFLIDEPPSWLLIPSLIGIYVAPIAALVGLYIYEHLFVMAPQEVPNS